MKLYRNAVILVVVFGLMVGAYFIIKARKPADGANTTGDAAKTIKILDINQDKLAEVTLKTKDATFVFTKKDKDWTMSSPSGIKTDKSKIESFVSNISSLDAEKVVEENATDLAQYGLSDAIEVTAKLADGSTQTIELGSETATKEGYYVKTKSSNKVYTISTYAGDAIKIGKNDLRDKILFTVKPEEVIGFSMEKAGNIVFSSKKISDSEWNLTAPIEGNADISKVSPMIDAVTKTVVKSFIEDNAADLGKYGLEKPAYSLEMETASGKIKLLMGDEKQKGTEIYAKMSDSNDVFTIDETAFNFLDKPLTEIMEVFAYIVNINDVSKIVVDMDGQSVISTIETNKDDKDKDKFTVNGKDATMKDKNDKQPFRTYYQALIGVTLSDIDAGANPTGKADITFTYSLKKAPGTMKVEFIPKDDKYYYVVKNGKYSGILVEKKKFDEQDGVRDSYKKLMEAITRG